MTPYLSFNGKADEALNFYKDIFGGDLSLNRYEGSPMESHFGPDYKDKVMHGSLVSAYGTIMASDNPETKVASGDDRVSLSINVKSTDADHVFGKLSEGGTVTMPLGDVFWGGKFGMCVDKYGFTWLLSVNE